MILTADYHTHTKYSHGKGTVIENAIVASQKGLKEIGITDHGFAHPAFGLRKKKLSHLVNDCAVATKQTGVKTLVGIESNIIGVSGVTDLKIEYYDYFDIYLAGIHKLVKYKADAFLPLSLPNLMCSTFKVKNISNSLIEKNTKTFINVIKNNPVDIITHLNFCCYANAVEVAKVAADYGTYLELNAKKVHLTDEELFAISKTGVNFVISSDAHSPQRVGDIALIEQVLNRVEIPLERIHNIDGRTPTFRFAKFKGDAGR